MDQSTFMPQCDTGFTMDRFEKAAEAVAQELSTNPTASLRYEKVFNPL